MNLRYDPPPKVASLEQGCSKTMSLGIIAIHERIVTELDADLPNLARSPWAGYNCRWVNGSNGPRPGSLSAHATGRAFDVMALAERESELIAGNRLCSWLVDHAETLGVQMIIWNRNLWGRGVWSWRPIGRGVHPHHDHVHFELSHAHDDRTLDDWRTVIESLPAIVDTDPTFEYDVPVTFAPVPGARRNARGLVPGWWIDTDGTVTAVEGAEHHGDTTTPAALDLDEPVVALVPTRTGRGYWIVTADLGVLSFGDAIYPRDHPAVKSWIDAAGGLAAPIIGSRLAGPDPYSDEDDLLVSFSPDGGVFPLPVTSGSS